MRVFLRSVGLALIAIAALPASAFAQLAVSPASLSFGNQVVGTTSAPRTVTLTNGSGAAQAFAIATTGDYATTSACGASVPAGSTCQVAVTFTPTVLGARPGTLAITPTATGVTTTVTTSGTGVTPTTVSPPALAFGAVVQHTTSATKTVRLTNNLDVPLTGIALTTSTPEYSVTGCPATLGARARCTASVVFTPAAVPGTSTPGTLTLTHSGANSPQVVPLTGSSTFPITLSAAAVSFPRTVQGSTAKAITVTLRNNQRVPLRTLTITAPAPFAATGCGSLPVNPGKTCQVSLTYTPGLGDPLSVTRTLVARSVDPTVWNQPQARLSGTALPQLTLTPTTQIFTDTSVGATSAARTISLKNNRATAITLGAPLVTFTGAQAGEFARAGGTCGATLASGATCTVGLTFTPRQGGVRTATVQVHSNALGTPFTATLSGVGTTPMTVSPTALSFGASAVGLESAPRLVTLTNNQNIPVVFGAMTPTGDFSVQSTTCAASLAPGASCTVSVTMRPTIGGARTGSLSIGSTTSASPNVIALSGTGNGAVTASPTSLSFPSQKIATPSASRQIVYTNHQAVPAALDALVTGEFTATTACGGTIPARSSCVVSVVFTPTATGARAGLISVNDPGSTRRLDVRLSGSGTTTDPPAAITNVSPGAGAVGTAVTGVVVTGNGYTRFSPASVVTVGAGISVSNLRTVTANSLTVDLAIAANALPGGRTASVVTPLSGGGTETATLTAAFVVSTSPDPSYITIAPVSAAQGETIDVVIEGDNTTFAQATATAPGTTANFGPGVAVNGAVQVLSATRAVANVTVSPTADLGWRTVTVVTGGQFATLRGASPDSGPGFLVTASNAVLTAASPAAGQQGATPFVLTITGVGTHFLQGATTVSLGEGITIGNVTVVSRTEIQASIAITGTAVPGLRTARVATGGEVLTLTGAFTVTPSATAPYLTSVQPAQATQGQSLALTISGVNTSFTTQAPTLTIGGGITVNSLTVVNATTLTADVAVATLAQTGVRQGTLTSGGAQFSLDFTVLPRPVSITSVAPSIAAQGEVLTVRITGQNTSWNQDTTFARFVSPSWCDLPTVNRLTVIDATNADLLLTVPTSSCTGTLGFQVATGGESASGSFGVYRTAPSLTLSPSTGLVGSTLTVNLIGEFSHFSAGPAGATTAAIDGADVQIQDFTVTSPTTATATFVIDPAALSGPCIPVAQSGCHTVTITTPRGGDVHEVLMAPFRVVSTPAVLTRITPDRALPGTTVVATILGAYTNFTAGLTTVGFGPDVSVSTVTVVSRTEVRATIAIAANAATGYRSAFVNTGNEQVTIGFLVESPESPSLTSVTPSTARQGQSATVTILGRNTTFGPASALILGAGVTVSDFAVESPTRATAVIQVATTAPVGRNPVAVITPTPDGQEVVTGAAFFVEPGVQRVLFTKNASAPDPVAPYAALPVAQGQTLNVALVGEGTNWRQGGTVSSLGGGIVVNQLTVADATHATAQITVLSTAALGFREVVMTTGGESASMAQALSVQQATPVLLSTSPLTGAQGTTFNVQLLGRFTSWQQGLTQVDYGDDVRVNSVTVVDSVSAVANVTIAPTAYRSPTVACRTVSVTTGQQQVVLPDQLCVSAGAATLTAVTPSTSTQGSTVDVAVTGQATNFTAGLTTADFGPGVTVNNVQVLSPTEATVALGVSTDAVNGYRTVTLRTLGETASLPLGFVVGQSTAALSAAAPISGQQGQQNLVVRLFGQNTSWSQGVTAVNFGAGVTVDGVVVVVNATTLDATIDIAPNAVVGPRTVTVTTGGQIVSAQIFAVTDVGAIITRVTPDNGNQGQEMELVVSGQGTAWLNGVTQFSMTGVGRDAAVNYVLVSSPTELRVGITLAPTAELGGRSVFVTTGTQALVNPASFVVTGGIPAIASVRPGSAKAGDTGVNVEVLGLYTEWLNGSTTIDFGPGVTVLNYVVNSSTSITAVLDIAPAAGLGGRTVVVRNGLQTLTGSFAVVSNAPPTPSVYLAPPSALRGQTRDVEFTGHNTNWNTTSTLQIGDPGTSGISINSFQVLGPTQAMANVTITGAAPFASHQVDIATGNELVQAQFAVVQEQPQITIVDPSSGMQGTTRTVTVLGLHTPFDTTTTFDFGQGLTVEAIDILGPTAAQVRVAIDQLAPLGTRTVTATTAGVSVSKSPGFTVTASAAEIVSVSPNTARQNARLTVSVTGRNTNWTSSTVFGFGSGITERSKTVSSPTQASVEIELAALATLGGRPVTATTVGEVASLSNGFVVQEGTPLVLSSAPTTGMQQQAVTLAILGQFTQWAQGQTTVSIEGGVNVTSTTVTSPTSITVQAAVDWFAVPGARTIRVTTGNDTESLPGGFVVVAGPAAITQVAPAQSGQGTTLNVVVTGVNTHFTQGSTTASFGSGIGVNSMTVSSPTIATVNITVAANASPGLRHVALTTVGETATLANAFTVVFTTPTIQFVTPTSLAQGASGTVTVIGENTSFSSQTVFRFGPDATVGTATIVSAVEARVPVTVQPLAARTTRDVTATTGAQVATGAQKFTVSAGPARITALSPSIVKQNTNGVQVTISGISTNFAPSSVVDLGSGVAVTNLQVINATQVVATVNVSPSASLGLRTARVTTGGEVAELAGVFEVRTGDPVLTAITPTSARQGQTVTVQLNALYTTFTTGSPSLALGAGVTINALTVLSDTQLSASVTVQPTAAVGTRVVSLTSSGQSVSTSGFTFGVTDGQPELLTVSPNTGDQGSIQVVTIIGRFTNFSLPSVVSFGGSGLTAGALTVNGPTQIQVSVTVSLGAAPGVRTVTVTTGSEVVALMGAFTVLASPPAITIITPNVGVPNSTVNVTITGRFTSFSGGTTQARFGAGVSVNGGAAGAFGPLTVQSATQATATLAIDSAAALGPRDVTVRTGDEVLDEPEGFTVQSTSPTAPSITSITPYNGEGDVPTNTSVTVEFSAPIDRSTVSIANVRLTDYVTQSGCWASYTASLPGTVSVSASGRVVTFTPTSVLAVGRRHEVCVNYGQQGTPSGIKDPAGNAVVGQVYYFTTGFAPDASGPTFVASNIAPADTGVPTEAPITLGFTRPVSRASIAGGVMVTASGSVVPGTFSYTNDYRQVTFTPTVGLALNTSYAVTYTGAIEDSVGTPLTNPGSFTFTTAAAPVSGGPLVVGRSPQQSATAGVSPVIRLTLDRPIDPLRLTSGNVYLYNNTTNTVVPETRVFASGDRRTVTWEPGRRLEPGTVYTVYAYVYDRRGNASYSSWSFLTEDGTDTTTPTIGQVAPAAGSTAVPTNVRIRFRASEPLDRTSGPIVTLQPSVAGTLSSSDDREFVFAPSTALAASTPYTVTLTGMRDSSGNAVPDVAWSFTTGATTDSASGTVTAITPDGATTVPVSTSVVVSLSEAVAPSSVNASSLYVVDQVTGQPVAGTLSVSTDGRTITFMPSSPLSPSRGYTVWVSYYGALLDLSGNVFNYRWQSFTTAAGAPDTTAPLVTVITPFDGAEDIGPNHPITITFSEAMRTSTLTAANIAVFAGSDRVGVGVAPAPDGRSVTLTAQFAYGMPHTVLVSPAVTDLAGNTLPQQFVSVFLIGDRPVTSRPEVRVFRPGSGLSDIPGDRPLVFMLSQPIDPATVPSALYVAQDGVLVTGTTTFGAEDHVVTFRPSVPFRAGARVEAWFTNKATDPYGNALYDYQASFTVKPATVTTPGHLESSPTWQETQVPTTTRVDIRFNTRLQANTVTGANVFLTYCDGSVRPSTLQLLQDDTVVRVTPSAPLPANGTACVSWTSQVLDAIGRPLQASYTQFHMSSTADTTAPTLVSAAPYDGATRIGVNARIGLTFSERLALGSLAPPALQLTSGGAALPYALTSLANPDGTFTVTLVPSDALPASASVTVTGSAALVDRSGRAIAPFVVTFTTMGVPDYSSARIVSSSVTSGDVNVPITSAFSVRYERPIDARTVNASTVYLYDPLVNRYLPATLHVSPDRTELSLVPLAPLAINRYHSLTVSGVYDLTGNAAAYAGITFTTALKAPVAGPVVLMTSPYAGMGGVPSNFRPAVRFDRAIDRGSLMGLSLTANGQAVPFTTTVNQADSTVIVVPLAPLSAGTSYLLTIAGVRDAAGVAMAAPVSVPFTIGPGLDLNAPTMVSATPPDGSTTGTAPVLRWTHSEPIDRLRYTPGHLYNQGTGGYVQGISFVFSSDWKTISLLYPGTLDRESYYQACVGSVVDLAGNGGSYSCTPFVTGGATWTSPLTVETVTPANGAAAVATNTPIRLRFSRAIDPTSLTQSSFAFSPGLTTSVQLSTDRRTATLTPSAGLAAGATYTLTASGLHDVDGNVLTTFVSTFTAAGSADSTGGTITLVNPAPGATGVPTGASITVALSEPVDPLSVNEVSLNVNVSTTNTRITGTITVASDGRSLTLVPSVPLPAGAQLTVAASYYEALRDVAGNTFSYHFAYFTTAAAPDTTAPTLLAVAPVDGTPDIGPWGVVSLRFSEAIDPSTINGANFALYDGYTNLNASIDRTADNRTVTMRRWPLPYGKQLTVVIGTGVTDLAGNALVASFRSTFTTLDPRMVGIPQVTSTRPGQGATNVTPTTAITLFTTKPVSEASLGAGLTIAENGVAVPGTVTVDDGYSIVFRPTAPFTAGALVQVFLTSQATDVAGNPFTAWSSQFSVAQPSSASTFQVVSYSPGSGGTAPRNTVVDIRFSKPVDPATVTSANVYAWSCAGGTQAGTLTLLSPTVIRLTPAAPLPASNCVYVYLQAGLRSTDGSAFGATSLYFTTTADVDATTPTTTAITPPHGSSGVGDNAAVRIRFSERMAEETFSPSTVTLTSGGQPLPYTMSFTSSEPTVVTLTPQAPLPDNADVTVAISPSITDRAGLPVSAVTSTFRTGVGPDTTVPQIVRRSIQQGQVVPLNTTTVSWEFSEPLARDTITPTTIWLYRYSTGSYHYGTPVLSSDGRTIVFPLPIALSPGVTYQICISSISDLASNNTAACMTFSAASAESVVAPTVIGTSPSAGATGTVTNSRIELVFSTVVDQTSLGGLMLSANGQPVPFVLELPSYGGNLSYGQVVRLVPLSLLAPNTAYTVSASGVKDAAGNTMAASFGFTFTTGGNVQAVGQTTFQTATVTANGVQTQLTNGLTVTGVETDTSAAVTFSRAVGMPSLLAGGVHIRLRSTGAVVPASIGLSADGRTVTLTPLSPLAASTQYEVSVNYYIAGVYDVAGYQVSGNAWAMGFQTVP